MVRERSDRGRVRRSAPDLADVQGQETAKRALEIAAAGGHPILLVGPGGSGKSLLGRCLPGLLPALSRDGEAALAEFYRRANLEPPCCTPLRLPHPSVTPSALLGRQRPGEVDLARGGVLFLDDLQAFGRRSLRALRESLETAPPRLSREPSLPPFLLAAAMRSCPCGCFDDPRRECTCPRWRLTRHWAPVRELLLDRFHLHVELHAVSAAGVSRRGGEASTVVAMRVRVARDRQRERHGGPLLKAHLQASALVEVCPLDSVGRQLLDHAGERLSFTAQTTAVVLRVARTIADLAGGGGITAPHLAEAIHYQALTGVERL